MEYIRGSRAPDCMFHNHYKTLYNLFSSDPAVSRVADTEASHRDIYLNFTSFCVDITLSFILGV